MEGSISCWDRGFIGIFIFSCSITLLFFHFLFVMPLMCCHMFVQWDQLDAVYQFNWNFSNLEVSQMIYCFVA